MLSWKHTLHSEASHRKTLGCFWVLIREEKNMECKACGVKNGFVCLIFFKNLWQCNLILLNFERKNVLSLIGSFTNSLQLFKLKCLSSFPAEMHRLVVPNKGYSSLDQSPDEKPLVALDTDRWEDITSTYVQLKGVIDGERNRGDDQKSLSSWYINPKAT